MLFFLRASIYAPLIEKWNYFDEKTEMAGKAIKVATPSLAVPCSFLDVKLEGIHILCDWLLFFSFEVYLATESFFRWMAVTLERLPWTTPSDEHLPVTGEWPYFVRPSHGNFPQFLSYFAFKIGNIS